MDTCHWTDQKHEDLELTARDSEGLISSLCDGEMVLFVEQSAPLRSTSWSRRLTQFYYVPYAITWKRACEIQEIHVCMFNGYRILWTPH